MKRKFYFFVIAVLISTARAGAQSTEPIHVGIIPFNVIEFNAGANSSLVEDQVASCFANRSRFVLIDRGITEKLKEELERAKENSALYSKIVAEQGHLYGAQYLITGKVGAMDVSSSIQKNIYNSSTTYHGTVPITVQINSVETGQVIYSFPFTEVSSEMNTSSRADILSNILCHFQSDFRAKVRSIFSVDINIVKIETEKNGEAREVLINGGGEMFGDGKNTNCEPTGTLGRLWKDRKIRLDVISVENIGTSKREKKIGELVVKSVEGDFSLCTVSKGEKEIKQYFDNKQSLMVRSAK